MKKIIIPILAFFFSICSLVPLSAFADGRDDPNRGAGFSAQDAWCYADDNRYLIQDMQKEIGDFKTGSNEKLDDIKNSMVDETEKGVANYFEAQNTSIPEDDNPAYSVFSFVDALVGGANNLWVHVGNTIKEVGYTNEYGFSLDVKSYANNTINSIFRIFGYSLVLLFFAMNLIESTIKYEIFTLKGGLMTLGRLMVSKIFIDLSGTICLYLIDISGNLANQILESGTENFELIVPNIRSFFSSSDLWVIGSIIDVVVAVFIAIPVVLIALLVLITVCLVTVRLILRSIELSMMLAVSPAFFACYSSEVTKPYFKNFIVTFLQVVLQIVFMAVVYYIASNWMTTSVKFDEGIKVLEWFMQFLPNALVLLAMSIMMIKPPKVLTNLLK